MHDFTLRYSFCHNFLSQSVDHRDSHAESTLFVGRKKKKKIPYLYFINVVRLSLFLVFVFALCPIDSSKHSGCAVVEPLPWYTQVSEVQLKKWVPAVTIASTKDVRTPFSLFHSYYVPCTLILSSTTARMIPEGRDGELLWVVILSLSPPSSFPPAPQGVRDLSV